MILWTFQVICLALRLPCPPCCMPLQQPLHHLQILSAVILHGLDPVLLPGKAPSFNDDFSLIATLEAYQVAIANAIWCVLCLCCQSSFNLLIAWFKLQNSLASRSLESLNLMWWKVAVTFKLCPAGCAEPRASPAASVSGWHSQSRSPGRELAV